MYRHFTYTFYQPGTYILFVSLYDSDEQLIMVNGSEYIFTYPYISISEGTAANPLTNAVHTAANACQKSNDFDTAVAINDYLAEHITYDNADWIAGVLLEKEMAVTMPGMR